MGFTPLYGIEYLKQKKLKQILKIALLIGTLISLYFVPWIVVKAWILPLPDTVQEQANEAVDNGSDFIQNRIRFGGKKTERLILTR